MKEKIKKVMWAKDSRPFISQGQWFLIFCLIVVVGISVLTRFNYYYYGTKEYIKRGWVEKLYRTPQSEVKDADNCRFVSLPKHSRTIYKKDKKKKPICLHERNSKT